MIHLTMTGYHAGVVICGAKKHEHADDEYVHAMYAPQVILDSPDLCPVCKSYWDNADNSDEEQ